MNEIVNNGKKTVGLSDKRGKGWFIAALVVSLIAIAVFAFYAALTVSTVEAALKLREGATGNEQLGAGLGAAFGLVFMIIFGGAELVVGIPATILSWVGVSRSDPPYKLCNTVLGIIDAAVLAVTVISFVVTALMI